MAFSVRISLQLMTGCYGSLILCQTYFLEVGFAVATAI